MKLYNYLDAILKPWALVHFLWNLVIGQWSRHLSEKASDHNLPFFVSQYTSYYHGALRYIIAFESSSMLTTIWIALLNLERSQNLIVCWINPQTHNGRKGGVKLDHNTPSWVLESGNIWLRISRNKCERLIRCKRNQYEHPLLRCISRNFNK